jgi:hypothetical protein
MTLAAYAGRMERRDDDGCLGGEADGKPESRADAS